MPLFPRFVPTTSNADTMDMNTLLNILACQEPQSNHHSYYNQSPSHSSPSNASHHATETKKERSARSAGVPPVVRAFTPNFDILETPQAFVLEGELPGLSDKKAIDIEFTDHQTLLVKGRIEKVLPVVPAPTAATTTEAPAPVEAKQIDEKPHQEHEEHPRPRTPPKPTVEDEVDEDDGFSAIVMIPSTTTTITGATAATEPPKTTVSPKPTTPPIRYWVSERTIGAFQRSFSFPGLIDQDSVTAKLEHGLLTIVVPKRSKLASKKIQID